MNEIKIKLGEVYRRGREGKGAGSKLGQTLGIAPFTTEDRDSVAVRSFQEITYIPIYFVFIIS